MYTKTYFDLGSEDEEIKIRKAQDLIRKRYGENKFESMGSFRNYYLIRGCVVKEVLPTNDGSLRRTLTISSETKVGLNALINELELDI